MRSWGRPLTNSTAIFLLTARRFGSKSWASMLLDKSIESMMSMPSALIFSSFNTDCGRANATTKAIKPRARKMGNQRRNLALMVSTPATPCKLGRVTAACRCLCCCQYHLAKRGSNSSRRKKYGCKNFIISKLVVSLIMMVKIPKGLYVYSSFLG